MADQRDRPLIAHLFTEDGVQYLQTSECDTGCGFYKNDGLDAGQRCRRASCSGQIALRRWRVIPPVQEGGDH